MLITIMLEKAGSEQAARSVSKERVTRGRRNRWDRRAARAGQCSSSNNNWGTDQTERNKMERDGLVEGCHLLGSLLLSARGIHG